MKARSGKSRWVVLAVCALFALSVTAARGADQLDPSFGAGGVAKPPLPEKASRAEAGIVDLAAAPDGTTVGALKGLAGLGYFGAVRLTTEGAPDSSFGEGGFTRSFESPRGSFNPEPQAEAVAVQGDGKVVVAGYTQEGIRQPTGFSPLVVRYQADGSLDPGFGDNGSVAGAPRVAKGGTVLNAVALAPDGRIIVAGGRNEGFRGFPGAAGVVVAYKPDGSVDSSFGRSGRVLFVQHGRFLSHTSLRAVEVLGSGKILVAGYRNFHPFLARLRPDGSLDRGFGGGDGMSVLRGINNGVCCPTAALAVQKDGRIVVASNGGPLRKGQVLLVRYRPNGTLDRSFGDRGIEHLFGPWRLSEATDVAIQGNGGILTVGRGERTKGSPRGFAYGIFRNRPNGHPDRSFGNHGLRTFRFGAQSYAGGALAQPDGGILTGGSYATVDKSSGRYVTTLLLARFLGGRR